MTKQTKSLVNTKDTDQPGHLSCHTRAFASVQWLVVGSDQLFIFGYSEESDLSLCWTHKSFVDFPLPCSIIAASSRLEDYILRDPVV